jgi:hypothetical protein
MRPLTLDEALAEADRHRGRGRERLRAVAGKLAPRGKVLVRTLSETAREEFLDIAWIEIDETRHLMPEAHPRTLRAVATRIIEEFGSFAALVAAVPQPGLDPAWFRACADIEREGFDWARWVRPWLVPAVESEKRHSPRTNLYVWEGVHSTIALAVELMRNQLEWRPVEVVCCLEQPT